MNSLKPVFVVVVLAAVAYGVYVSINRNPETTALDDAPPWAGGPKVQMPGQGSSPPQSPGGPNVQIPGPNAQIPAPASAGSQVPGPGAARSVPAGGTAAAARPYGPIGASGGGPTGNSSPTAAGPGGTTPQRFTPPASRPKAVMASAAGASALAARPNPVRPSAPSAPAKAPPSDLVPGASPPNTARINFATYLQNVRQKLNKGQLAEAHLALSSLYNNPSLPPEEAQKVTDLLDQLAGTVIYSRRHLLEGRPYVVKQGENLEQIARLFKVPWQLLARINGVGDPNNLTPGQELKVVRGPFNAVIDLGKHELTMMVKGRYAGRFPIGVGADHPNLAGSYAVRDKTANPQYYGPDRQQIGADDPNNPLGEHWIGLGNQIGIHGTNDPATLQRTGGRGCIRMSARDVDDVFGILSIGSRVVIRR